MTAYNLPQLLFDRGDSQPAQPYVRKLNKGPLVNAESMWLGIKIELKLRNPDTVADLADQLRDRFAESSELIAYEKGAFLD